MASELRRRTSGTVVFFLPLVAQAADDGGGSLVGTFVIASLPLLCFCVLVYVGAHDSLRIQIEDRLQRWWRGLEGLWNNRWRFLRVRPRRVSERR